MLTQSSLQDLVAQELSARAIAISDEWVDRIEHDDRQDGASHALVSDLRQHIPELVRSVVEFMRDPGRTSRSAVITQLRLHADRRQARGYDIHQLLTDFECLSRLMFAAFSDAVEKHAEVANVRDVADLAGRLREGLMQITSEGVGMYRQAELEQKRALAKKLSDFARGMTHELKNPLGAAKSGTQMLQDLDVVKTADDRDRFIRLILRNLVRMQDLIHDIRALALADDSDRMERWIPLDALVAKVYDELRPDANKKGVSLEIETPLPAVTIDAARLEIALANLIGNAIKYSDPEKADRRVIVRAAASQDRRKGHRVLVEVRDNGLGIPKDLHDSVFKQHFRAHKGVAEGTGLGLAIANELISGSGGRIWFESEPGTGSVFFVEMPEGGDRRVG